MTTREKILRYLDRMSRNIAITNKRISLCGDKEVIDIKQVRIVMAELVQSGEWESFKCLSSDGERAYRRVNK